jgi:hypothetical protein
MTLIAISDPGQVFDDGYSGLLEDCCIFDV